MDGKGGERVTVHRELHTEGRGSARLGKYRRRETNSFHVTKTPWEIATKECWKRHVSERTLRSNPVPLVLPNHDRRGGSDKCEGVSLVGAYHDFATSEELCKD